MKRLATIALALLAVSSAADSRKPPKGITLPRGCRDRGCVRERTVSDGVATPSYAQFEFAPSNGTGMGAACACTTPTGAKGEALTFTRGSSGTCLKGGTVSGIANGDMVTCSTNQARVMPGGSGTGPLGLLHEETRTNLVLRSEEFENAAWNTLAAGVAAPTVTADQASGPNTNQVGKADRVQFPAITAAQTSMIFTASAIGGAGNNVCSLFVRGNGTSDASGIDLVKYNSGVATYDAVRCPYTSTGWTRCETPPTNGASTTFACYIGHAGVAFSPGLTARSAADVFLIGAQGEAGASASSYIATAGATGTRSSEQLTYLAYSGPSLTNGSMAATVVCGDTLCGGAGEHGIVSLQIGSSYDHLLLVQTGSSNLIFYSSSGSVAAGASVTANAPMRAAASWTGTSGTATWNGASASGSVAAIGAVNRFGFGAYNATLALINGVVKQVCLDPSPSRCR